MLCAGRPRWQEEHNRPLFLISLPVCQTTSHRRCYNCRFWPLIPTRYAHLASIPSCLLPTITQDSVWHRNVGVQGFDLGLDFNTGPSGARLAMGSYVVVQVPRSGELDWDDWGYDTRTQTIVRTRLARGEKSHILPYNAIIFRVSKYQSKKVRKANSSL